MSGNKRKWLAAQVRVTQVIGRLSEQNLRRDRVRVWGPRVILITGDEARRSQLLCCAMDPL